MALERRTGWRTPTTILLILLAYALSKHLHLSLFAPSWPHISTPYTTTNPIAKRADSGSDAGTSPAGSDTAEEGDPVHDQTLNYYSLKGAAFACLLDQPTLAAMESVMVHYNWLAPGQPSASPFARYEDLAASGWDRDRDDTGRLDLARDPPLAPMLAALGLDARERPQGDNKLTGWTHDREIEVGGPTDADFSEIYNPTGGAIIRKYNYSPVAMIAMEELDMPPPPLKQWSDVAFLEYREQARAQNKDVKLLRYIFSDNVQNELAEWMVARILEPDTEDWRSVKGPPWERKRVFGMEEPAAQALLASPHGNGLVWMLVQRRAELGWKRVKSVTLWQDQMGPSFVFELEVGTIDS
ncbi:hypothetical protein LTR08_009236 [Meristemomyces frigidus]|nr:hypothetical protein LTR08_009236 [Meristemomyces frigidus]